MSSPILGPISSGGGVSGDTLVVTFNRSQYSDCSVTSQSAGLVIGATSGTNGSVSGTVKGSTVQIFALTGVSGYSNPATQFAIRLSTGGLPASYFTSIEIPGIATFLSSSASSFSNDSGFSQWFWSPISVGWPANGAVIECLVI